MKISKISPSTRVPGRWLCCLEDGDILRVTENEIAAFGLYAGMELTREHRAALTAALEKGAVRDRALRLLSQRPMSRRELLDKLTARPRDPEKPPADPALAEEVCDRLEELGYLNDAEYAKTVVRHYSAKGYGARKIRDELWKRGVPRELWDSAVEEAEPPEDGIDALLRRKLRGEAPPDDPKALKRLTDALARRGYRWDDIRSALRRCGAELEE